MHGVCKSAYWLQFGKHGCAGQVGSSRSFYRPITWNGFGNAGRISAGVYQVTTQDVVKVENCRSSEGGGVMPIIPMVYWVGRESHRRSSGGLHNFYFGSGHILVGIRTKTHNKRITIVRDGKRHPRVRSVLQGFLLEFLTPEDGPRTKQHKVLDTPRVRDHVIDRMNYWGQLPAFSGAAGWGSCLVQFDCGLIDSSGFSTKTSLSRVLVAWIISRGSTALCFRIRHVYFIDQE